MARRGAVWRGKAGARMGIGKHMNDAHPLDFKALQKDEEIPQERIEVIYNIRRSEDPDRYRVRAQLALKSEIERHRPDLAVRTRGAGLLIMGDRELERHTMRRTELNIAEMLRNSQRRALIIRDDFSDSEKRAAEANDHALSGIAIAARRALLSTNQTVAKLLRGGKDKDQ